MYAHPPDPWDRAGCGNGDRGCHRQRCRFSQGSRVRSMARDCAPPYSTGGKAKLLGISKRGNVYLRKIIIHGARAAVLRIKRDRAPIGAWLDALDSRAPKNVVVVAMANKLARIAWAVLSSGEDYRPNGNM